VATAEAESAAEAAKAAQAGTAPAPAAAARPAFSPGDPVRVARYGVGVVEAVDGEGVTVRFLDGPSRVFLADYVRPAKAARSAAAAAKPRRAAGPRVA